MKRLDLIFSERELDEMLTCLEAAEVPGYTVMKHATGRGPERVVSGSGPGLAVSESLLLDVAATR